MASDFFIPVKEWCNCQHAQTLKEALDDARAALLAGDVRTALLVLEEMRDEDKSAGEAYAHEILGARP